jgi:RND family efflux transporter MFP subunit
MKRTLAASVAVLLAVAPALAEDATIDCVSEPAQRVEIGSTVTGLLSEALVGRGDRVQRGDVLARLDATIEEANVAVAKAQAEANELVESQQTRLTLAEANLERSRSLLTSGSVTQSRIDELQALVDITRNDLAAELRRQSLAALELERQEALLSLRTITSPLDGFVLSQAVQVGEYVRQDSTVFTIVQTDPLYVEAYVPVSLFGRIELGASGADTMEQPADTRETAEITVIDPIFDAASGTFGIRLDLPNPDDALPAGQRCEVTFTMLD